MNWLVKGILATVVLPCAAQDRCAATLSRAASRLVAVRSELARIPIVEMTSETPSVPTETIARLKNEFSQFSDVLLSCASPSINPKDLQRRAANLLHANDPETAAKSDDDPGTYASDLGVEVRRPPDSTNLLTIQYSINVGCGEDNTLLVYELQKDNWVQKLRWQTPSLTSMADAFGDFFLVGILQDPSAGKVRDSGWRLVVAHGTPWCTSRFSGFKIDLLQSGREAASPQILWHAERAYSRGSFEPRMKVLGNTFELRLNADCMWFDIDKCFERRVIYRYNVDLDGQAHRENPLGLNARGFVEEWLAAPWSEAKGFTTPESLGSLQELHDRFDPQTKSDNDQFRSHRLGPVRACAPPATYQVQVDSSLERIVPGKPGGDSKPLPSNYFHVREVAGGYVMLSAPITPDPACNGPDLMPEER